MLKNRIYREDGNKKVRIYHFIPTETVTSIPLFFANYEMTALPQVITTLGRHKVKGRIYHLKYETHILTRLNEDLKKFKNSKDKELR